ncbi:MAG: ABC transporter substrate-binding protein, partial [Bacteroidales bacterium]
MTRFWFNVKIRTISEKKREKRGSCGLSWVTGRREFMNFDLKISSRIPKAFLRKFFLCFLAISIAGIAMGAGQKEQGKVEIELLLVEAEYSTQTNELLKMYTKENPNITFKIHGWTEGQDAVWEARIAAGDPPHIFENAPANPITKDRYEFLYDLRKLDYPYWDRFDFDVKSRWSEVFGVPNYLPILPIWSPVIRTFIYDADKMKEAGLNPKETVKTLADLETFLAQLKKYVDSKGGTLQYVFDMGWTPNGYGRGVPFAFTTAVASLDEQYAVWEGKIRWDDMERSPYAKSFALLKKWYDLGYFPPKFWTRQWEPDYEAGFIAGKSIFTWHGPWLWDKFIAAKPNAKLDGFTLPPNKNNLVGTDSFVPDNGVGIFKAHENKPIFNEIKKFFIWYNSPKIIKARAEIRGRVPLFRLHDMGLPDLRGLQYVQVVRP